MTATSSGSSTSQDTGRAVVEALDAAQKSLPTPAAWGVLFASPRHDLGQVLAAAHAKLPECDFLASSTAGELTERGATKGGLAAFLVTGEDTMHRVVGPERLHAEERGARALCSSFAELASRAAQKKMGQSTTLLLSDGLSPDIEKIIMDIRRATRPQQQVVGGGAGDDGALKQTFVGANQRAATSASVALHVFSARPWGVGVEHGLKPETERMTVTAAEGNVVKEIDGRPPFDVYRDYATARGLTFPPADMGAFLIQHELGVYFFEDLVKVRAPVQMAPDGSLGLVGAVPTGSSVCIVSGTKETMIHAARRAAREAREALGRSRCAGVLVFSCVCRGMLLGESYGEEIAAIKSVFPGVPIAGMLSYGEIARFKGRLDGYHNNTCVVVALPV